VHVQIYHMLFKDYVHSYHKTNMLLFLFPVLSAKRIQRQRYIIFAFSMVLLFTDNYIGYYLQGRRLRENRHSIRSAYGGTFWG